MTPNLDNKSKPLHFMGNKISDILRIVPAFSDCIVIIFTDKSSVTTDYIEFNADGTFELGAIY